MKVSAIIACFLLIIFSYAQAQGLAEVNQKVDKNFIATYHVLKTNPDIKWGQFLLHTRKKNMAIAMGTYKDNRRVGLWRFFEPTGGVMQLYDYDARMLKYEAPDEPAGNFKYLFDVPYKPTDTLTKPIKIGGRYYGYLPYFQLYIKPKWVTADDVVAVTAEFLISPGGRLADFSFHVSAKPYDGYSAYPNDDVLHVNLNNLSDEEKQFIPATKNGEPVSSRIIIRMTDGFLTNRITTPQQ